MKPNVHVLNSRTGPSLNFQFFPSHEISIHGENISPYVASKAMQTQPVANCSSAWGPSLSAIHGGHSSLVLAIVEVLNTAHNL